MKIADKIKTMTWKHAEINNAEFLVLSEILDPTADSAEPVLVLTSGCRTYENRVLAAQLIKYIRCPRDTSSHTIMDSVTQLTSKASSLKHDYKIDSTLVEQFQPELSIRTEQLHINAQLFH